MPSKPPSKKIRQQLATITNKRARIVIEHIIKHGFVTTEELEKKYGYNHPPRAARDVREAGIPLETFRVQSEGGRSIAAYRFGDLTKIRKARLQGRKTFPKKIKDALYETQNHKCAICAGEFEQRYFQVDHRVPYEVAGDEKLSEWRTQDLMLVCGSCNRAKSWSCEHCANWMTDKIPDVCLNCYWAHPESYLHIALQEIRRADILWRGNEVQAYERLKQVAQASQSPIPEYVKKIIARFVQDR
jgi:hypothetical protein